MGAQAPVSGNLGKIKKRKSEELGELRKGQGMEIEPLGAGDWDFICGTGLRAGAISFQGTQNPGHQGDRWKSSHHWRFTHRSGGSISNW